MVGVPLAPGSIIGRYEIDDVLGQGGFGITYRAYDHDTGQIVAIKEYFPQSWAVRDEDGSVMVAGYETEQIFRHNLGRFWEEAETLTRFQHPNIVRVLQRVMALGTAYIVLDYVPGPTLEKWALTSSPPSQEAVESFTAALLDALEVVHMNGYLHRDLKPQNILLRDGLPILIDFGSARVHDPSTVLTAMVTPNYAPFEQYQTSGQGQGPWTDIYGASATLYRVLTGHPPLDAMTRAMDDSQFEPISTTLAGRYRRQYLAALDWGLKVHASDRPKSVADWRGPLLEGWSVVHGETGLQTQTAVLPDVLDDPRKSMFGRLRDAIYWPPNRSGKSP